MDQVTFKVKPEPQRFSGSSATKQHDKALFLKHFKQARASARQTDTPMRHEEEDGSLEEEK